MADSLERLALAMRAQALIHRERGRFNRAKELEGFAFAVEVASLPPCPPCPPLPAPLVREPFAKACHDLGDRAQVVMRSNPGLRPEDQTGLRQLAIAAHWVGDQADVVPDLYTEADA